MGDVVAVLEDPSDRALVLHHRIVGHDLVDVVEVILMAGGQKHQIVFLQHGGVVGDPRLVELVSLLASNEVMSQVGTVVRLVDELQSEPG